MSLFYTRKGDRGESCLGHNQKIKKTRLEIKILGSLDELNSLLGLVKNQVFWKIK